MENEIVRTLDEAAEVIQQAERVTGVDGVDSPSGLGHCSTLFPERTYEEGMIALFNWLVGNDDTHPYTLNEEAPTSGVRL